MVKFPAVCVTNVTFIIEWKIPMHQNYVDLNVVLVKRPFQVLKVSNYISIMCMKVKEKERAVIFVESLAINSKNILKFFTMILIERYAIFVDSPLTRSKSISMSFTKNLKATNI